MGRKFDERSFIGVLNCKTCNSLLQPNEVDNIRDILYSGICNKCEKEAILQKKAEASFIGIVVTIVVIVLTLLIYPLIDTGNMYIDFFLYIVTFPMLVCTYFLIDDVYEKYKASKRENQRKQDYINSLNEDEILDLRVKPNNQDSSEAPKKDVDK